MMRRVFAGLVVVAALAVAPAARGTPSTGFWTPATIETQPFLVPHLTYDTWFGESGALQIDTGITLGVLDTRYLKAEAGVDLFFPTVTPQGQLGALDFVQLNGRVTVPEGALGDGVPGLSVGIARAGFKAGVSDFDLLHATVGKTFRTGTFGLGYYYGAGSSSLWTFHEGEQRGGVMASWISPRWPLGLPGLKAVDLRVDLAAARNWLGGGAAGVGLHFTDAIEVRTGAVLFVDYDFYERLGLTGWLWSIQLDVDVPLFEARTAAPPAQ